MSKYLTGMNTYYYIRFQVILNSNNILLIKIIREIKVNLNRNYDI